MLISRAVVSLQNWTCDSVRAVSAIAVSLNVCDCQENRLKLCRLNI